MESESRINNDEAVLFQEQDLNKVEVVAQSPNFESRETFAVEDNFDDGCSSTTGASGCRDTSVSPQRFSEIGHILTSNNVLVPESNINVEFSSPDPGNNPVSSDKTPGQQFSNVVGGFSTESSNPMVKTTTLEASDTNDANTGNGNQSIGNFNDSISGNNSFSSEFLSRQRALDRANVFLRWNLSPTKQQIKEFLEMAQGKLNLTMVSEKGYDYCLLYFELLRDGLINAQLWSKTTVEELDLAIADARQTLNNALTPPQDNKRRKISGNVEEETSPVYYSNSTDNDKIPLHILAKLKQQSSDFDDANSDFQGTPATSFNFELSDRSDENDGKREIENEGADDSFNGLEWRDVKGEGSKSGDDSLESSSSNSNKGTVIDSNRDGSDTDTTGENTQENDGSSSSRQDAMNRLLNPKSGCKGVSWSNRQMAWLAFWKEDNQRRSKTFSARKLGFEEAQRRAIEFLRRKREEVRMKTQAHLYEELPRVGSSSINSTSDTTGIKTPNRRSYSGSNAASTATPATPITPSFELDHYTNHSNQFIPGFDDSARNLITGTNPIFGPTGNILQNNAPQIVNHGPSVQQNVIQPNVPQQNILTATAAAAAAAAAAHQMGLPFHLAALSSMAGGIPMDPSISATVAAATGMNMGVQNSQQNQAGPMNNLTHAALMAANPFFMFGAAAAAAAAVSSGNGHVGQSNSPPHFPWQPFQNGGIGSLIQNPIQMERSDLTSLQHSVNNDSCPNLSEAREASAEINAKSSVNICVPLEVNKEKLKDNVGVPIRDLRNENVTDEIRQALS
ncbi:AP2/ERF domain containing protein [Cryptosporidium felis]|nr:AP2/ERF domain containing protein [Cryptosporidium felis]